MAVLVVVDGPDKGIALRVGHTEVGVSIGRGAGVRLALDGDDSVSRSHCRVWYDAAADCHLVTDRGSENGTFVGTDRLEWDRPLPFSADELTPDAAHRRARLSVA